MCGEKVFGFYPKIKGKNNHASPRTYGRDRHLSIRLRRLSAAPRARDDIPVIVQLVVLFIFLLVACGSAQGAGSKAELSWNVEAVRAESNDPLQPFVWVLVAGPEKEDIESSLPGLGKLCASIAKLTRDTVNAKKTARRSYQNYRQEISDAIRTRFGAGRPSVTPRLRRWKGERKTIAMKATFDVETFDAIQLILSSKAVKLGNEDAIMLEESTRLRPGFNGERLGPQPMAEIVEGSDYNLGLDPEVASDIKAWKDKFSFQIAFAESEISLLAERGKIELPEAREELVRQLETLAILLMSCLPDTGLVPGAAYDLGAIANNAENAISESIGVYAELGNIELQQNGRLDFRVVLNRFPSSVEIFVDGGGASRGRLEDYLRRRYIADNYGDRNGLLTSTFRYPYKAAVDADMKYLQKDSNVENVLQASIGEGGEGGGGGEGHDSIIFDVVKRPKLDGRLKLAAKLEVSPERDLTGMLSLDLSNMWEEIQRLEFSVDGGERTIGGQGKIVVPLREPLGGGRGPRLDVFSRADFREREDALYGNLDRDPVDERRDIAEAGLIWTSDSLTHHDRFAAENWVLGKRLPLRTLCKLDGGLRYSSTQLDGEEADLVGLDEGDATGPYLKGSVVFEHDCSSVGGVEAIERILWENDMDLSTALESLGSDENFTRVKLASGLRVLFRAPSPVASYFLHRWAYGWTGSNTPTYGYLGVGDRDFVRGLEEDEFIGRRCVAMRNEFGVNLLGLWQRFQPEDSDDEEAKKEDDEKKSGDDEKKVQQGTV